MDESVLLSRGKPLMWGQEQVPTWAYDVNARSIQFPDVNSFTYGPACLLIWKAFKVTVLLFIFSMVSALCATTCVSSMGHSINGLAPVPPWLYLPCTAVIIYVLWIEAQARKFTIVSQLVSMGERGFTIMGLAVGFKTWVSISTMISFASHADLITSGFFTARSIVTQSCKDNPFNATWQLVMSKTAFGDVLAHLRFEVMAILGWLLMATQFLYGIGFAMPSNVHDACDGKPLEMHFDLVVAMKDPQPEYDTWFGKSLGVAQSTIALAETTRMTTIISEEAASVVEGCHDNSTDLVKSLGAEFQRIALKSIVFLVFETAYQLNLQVAALGISKATEDNHTIDSELVLSLCFGFAMAVLNFVKVIQQTQAYRNICIEIGSDTYAAIIRDAQSQGIGIEFLHESGQMEHTLIQIKQTLATLSKVYPCLVLVWLVYSLLVLRAAFQASMVFYCSSGLYNLGIGCIELPST